MRFDLLKSLHDGILKFLEVSDIVRQDSAVLAQVQKDVDKMSKAQDQIFGIIRNHEGRVSCLEGTERARREGRYGP